MSGLGGCVRELAQRVAGIEEKIEGKVDTDVLVAAGLFAGAAAASYAAVNAAVIYGPSAVGRAASFYNGIRGRAPSEPAAPYSHP